MKPPYSDTPLFPHTVASEMERLAHQKHPQLIPHAQARLLQYRSHYESEHDRIVGTVQSGGRRFSRRLITVGLATSVAAAGLEFTATEAPNGDGPLAIAAGIGMVAVGLAWRRAVPNQQTMPQSVQLDVIDGYLSQLSDAQSEGMTA